MSQQVEEYSMADEKRQSRLPFAAPTEEEREASMITPDRLAMLADEVREIYLADNRPWIIGYSGGKDSTTALQVIWYALSELPPDKLTKPVFVISSDTMVETPVIVDHQHRSLDRMNESAQEQGVPFSAQLVRPPVKDTFWVNMIGRGYPAPYNKFRWCTDRLKIGPANAFIKDQVSAYGEVVLVLGVRLAESATRKQVMELHKREGHRLSRHTQLVNAWVYTPIENWKTRDVWTYLLQTPSPWGNNNRDLVTMYRSASGECPLVVDKTTPSCGNSRFGCWTCTVVERDRSMESAIDKGEEWMYPLLELRNWLTETRRPERKSEYRSHRRRSGRVDTWGDNKEKVIWGPYTMDFRREILRRVLRAQIEVLRDGPDPDLRLITEAELHEIRHLWRSEEGDWEDSIPKIYEEETGETLDWVLEEDGGARGDEEALLGAVAAAHELPQRMLKELIDVERATRGMSRRSNVYKKLESVMRKDWRTREEVFELLERRGNTQWSESEDSVGGDDAAS